MLSRRSLLASIAAGAAMQNRTAFAKAAQPSTPLNFDIPAGACDCHTHIFGEPDNFPFFPGLTSINRHSRRWRKQRVTSFRQIEANRRNSLRSTGPITEAGKHRSRRNAVRHGLCAETVVGTLEDIDDYKGFEAAIIADYDAETAVERELVLRLASLFWRIRRATAIETTLLGIQ
jgi:hypothetical protein